MQGHRSDRLCQHILVSVKLRFVLYPEWILQGLTLTIIFERNLALITCADGTLFAALGRTVQVFLADTSDDLLHVTPE